MANRKGIHANTRAELRSLKAGEQIVYGGGGFHITKKGKQKTKRQRK